MLIGLFEVSESRNFPHSAQTETRLDTIQYFLATSEVLGELEGRPEPAPEQPRRLVRWETTRVGQLFEMLVDQEKTCEGGILSVVRAAWNIFLATSGTPGELEGRPGPAPMEPR